MTTSRDHRAGRDAADEDGATPVLATTSTDGEYAGASAGAVIEGVLTLNGKGCFEVDGYILVAPHGSRALRDPLGIEVPDSGTIPVGARIYSAGAYVERLVEGPDDDEVTTWDEYATPSTKGFVVPDEPMTYRH